MNDLQEEIKKNKIIRDLVILDKVLNDIDISGLRADGLQFINVNLSGSDLSEAHWRNCRLEEVILDKAVFKNAIIRMCQWQNVRAEKSDFSHAKFENSKASGCVFDDANFSAASLADTDFSRASFRGAILDEVEASGTNFRGADLRNASLKKASFVDADLCGADFTGAKLEGVDLRGADLRGAIIDEAFQPQQQSELFSPAFEEMAVAVGPVVAELLRKGGGGGLLDTQTQASMMAELLQSGWGEQASKSAPSQIDNEVDAVLTNIAEIGIAPLLEALQQQSDTPSKSVASILEKLSTDFGLGESSTSEDLLARLVENFKKSSTEKRKK